MTAGGKTGIGCVAAAFGVVGVLILFNLMVDHPLLIPIFALAGYGAYRYGWPRYQQMQADKAHREAVEQRRRSDEAARQREIDAKVARHKDGLTLLAMFAMTDDRLARIEIDVLENYMRSAPYRYVTDMKLWVKSASPSSNDREWLLKRLQRELGDRDRGVLVDHLRQLRATKRRHAPIVEDWFDDAFKRLGGGAPPANPYDIQAI